MTRSLAQKTGGDVWYQNVLNGYLDNGAGYVNNITKSAAEYSLYSLPQLNFNDLNLYWTMKIYFRHG